MMGVTNANKQISVDRSGSMAGGPLANMKAGA